MFGNAPPGTKRITHSPYQVKGEVRYSDMTVYTTSVGSTVVATGSMQWNWGLDDFSVEHLVLTNPAVQQATRNILNKFASSAAGRTLALRNAER
jgi:hypothetical protein